MDSPSSSANQGPFGLAVLNLYSKHLPRRLLHWIHSTFSTIARWILGCTRRPYLGSLKFNVVVLGDGGVGKSALIQKAVYGRFEDEYDPTISDFYQKEVSARGQPCLLDITDLSGQDEIRTSYVSEISQADGVIYVYSITDVRSFDKISILSEEVSRLTEPLGRTVLGSAVIANKLDLARRRKVSTESGKEKASRLGAIFKEVSAKEKDHVDDVLRALTSRLLQSRKEGSENRRSMVERFRELLYLY